MRIAIILTTYS